MNEKITIFDALDMLKDYFKNHKPTDDKYRELLDELKALLKDLEA